MNIETANKILAKACGIEYSVTDGGVVLYDGDGYGFRDYKWTISDARVREVVRERFEIETRVNYANFGEVLKKYWKSTGVSVDKRFHGKGRTIAEAELACMIKIAEQLGESDVNK